MGRPATVRDEQVAALSPRSFRSRRSFSGIDVDAAFFDFELADVAVAQVLGE